MKRKMLILSGVATLLASCIISSPDASARGWCHQRTYVVCCSYQRSAKTRPEPRVSYFRHTEVNIAPGGVINKGVLIVSNSSWPSSDVIPGGVVHDGVFSPF